ncbi:sugar kinase [Bradyrhizobium sp.]|jgi:2-dehydro-3-deoxygluconokinase|uniref:sugar kinase n=1 Tax=Bradyrhizobium sp. TaxID=376 RepID=UPI003D14B8D9
MKVASIGECMVELSDGGAGLFSRAFGGDTLNTALYLARLGIETSYVTALGDDSLSSAMLDAWRAEGIHVDEVLRLPGRMPGLYMIERNALGERSFLYWRDRAPAREFFDLVDDAALERLSRFDWLYLSGITLSLYGDRGRARLIELLTMARRNGGRIAFDGNYRPRGWSDAAAARRAFDSLLPHVDLALPTLEDEQLLFGDADADSCAARLRGAGVAEIVVKTGARGCIVYAKGIRTEVPPEAVLQPVDTTAAGDSFNAGYLAGRISGASVTEAARAGHRLAGVVIRWPGAVIPKDAMPTSGLRKGMIT